MANSVLTYIKVNNQFVELREHAVCVRDHNYIEGAIVLEVDGQNILTLDHWDLVDQLWIYILEGLDCASHGQLYSAHFPDQPLKLELLPFSHSRIKVTIGDESHIVDRNAFFSTVIGGALEFFDEMERVCPSASDTWRRYANEARRVKASLWGSTSESDSESTSPSA